LVGIDDVHDDAALEHLGQPGLYLERTPSCSCVFVFVFVFVTSRESTKREDLASSALQLREDAHTDLCAATGASVHLSARPPKHERTNESDA
jgi:hypothetical protein